VIAEKGTVILASGSDVQRPIFHGPSPGNGYNAQSLAARWYLKMGLSGYEPTMEDMRGIFLAQGPDFKNNGEEVPPMELVDVYQVLAHLLKIPANPHNGTWSHVRGLLLGEPGSPTSSQVCGGLDACPGTETLGGGEDEEGCEGSGSFDLLDYAGYQNYSSYTWCLGFPAESDPSISFLVDFNRSISNYNSEEHTTKMTIGVTILNCKNLPETDWTWTQQEPDVRVEAKIESNDPYLGHSWTSTTNLIRNNKNPVFNQSLQIEVDRDQLFQSDHPRGPQLTLTVLDWDITDPRRKIATTSVRLADTDGGIIARKLSLWSCSSFWGCLFD